MASPQPPPAVAAVPRPGAPSVALLAGLASLALGLHAPAARAQAACPAPPAGSVWPGAAWEDRTAATLSSRGAEVKALEDYAFTLVGEDAARKGIRTDGVVIVRGGALVYEKYARGWTATQRHYTWSVAKSITNGLTGVAVAQGALSIDDSVCKHAELPAASCDITVKNLLEMSSGARWAETYENQSYQVSSVLAMLYGEGRDDMMGFVAGHPRRDAPGSTFRYSTGDATFLAGVVEAALRKAGHGADGMFTLLFDPIGMASAAFERDRRGTPVGGSWFYATPRDLARFGLLFLRDGCWSGKRLLPVGWVKDSTTPASSFLNAALELDDDDIPGRQWWLNGAVPSRNAKKPWKDLPDDAYGAFGHWGQSILVVPSLDLVVVRTADDRESGVFDRNEFFTRAMAVAR